MHIRTRELATALLALGIVTAGCSREDGDTSVAPDVDSVPTLNAQQNRATEEAVPEEENEAETTPADEPTPRQTEAVSSPQSQRGNLIKEIGETAGAYDIDEGPDSVWMEFQITDIEVDGQCTSDYADRSENGHFIIITVKASTGSDWPSDMRGLEIDFSPYEFSVIGPDGVTENDAVGSSYMCLASRDEIPPMGPGENASGKVVLDIAADTGILVYRPWFMYDGGWEWEF